MSNTRDGKTQLFTEYTESDERKNYALLETLLRSRMKELYGSAKRAYRDTHAKSHAAVRAHIEIFDIDESTIKQKLPDTGLTAAQAEGISIRQGLFARPGRYPVWLRFANGNGTRNPDSAGDTRSMSVKIIGVEGERLVESYKTDNQDIVTQNCDIFFISSIACYFSFLKAIFKSKILLVIWLLFHLGQALALKRITKFAPKSLLTERYWSGSAYSLGKSQQPDTCPDADSRSYPAVVKYSFTPVSPQEPHHELPRTSLDIAKRELPRNYYREELIEQLAKPDAKYCWDLGIQFQTDPDMSIDDITVSWPEDKSPFFTVGRLTVEHQVIDFKQQFDFCENLTFAPWNGLSAHRPVGALNRLRKLVYPLVAAYRHNKIGDDYREPTNLEMND